MSKNPQRIPLDIAQSVLAESGSESLYCHYGLFHQDENEVNDLFVGQQQFSQYLVERVSKACVQGAEILLIGPSMPAAAMELRSKGFKPKVVSDLQYPIPEAFSKSAAVVLEGSFTPLDQLPLLRYVKNVLQENGTLLLFGEYLLAEDTIAAPSVPSKTSLLKLSKRLGFELELAADLSESAIRSLNILREKSQLKLERPKWDELSSAIAILIEEFHAQRRSFELFQFTYNRKHIAEFPAADYLVNGEFAGIDISALFTASFGHAFDQELWHWKYLVGHGKSVVAKERPDGDIVSHYGGAPRDIQYFGASHKAIQVCDVMVDPRLRRHYGKSSLFFKTAATFLEREIGFSVAHLLGFGFPNKKTMKLAIRLGLYEKTDDFVELCLSASAQQNEPVIRLVEVNPENKAHREKITHLWQTMLKHYDDSIIGVRDWDYFNYRYFQHPLGRRGGYRRLFVEDIASGETVAALVLREHGGQSLLMEYIGDPFDMEWRLDQLLNCCEHAEILGMLKLWLTKSWVKRLAISSAVENNLGIEIPCNSWNAGPSAESLYGKWWLTAGDMDFL